MEASEGITSAAEVDEVVFETDVYLSKTLAGNLYLFHYPTKSSSIEVQDECLSAKIKPKQQKVEFEMAINTVSPNYDKDRGESIAFNVDGYNASGETYFKSSLMDKYTLSATKAGSAIESYAVGYLRKGELHITPLHSVVEFRPSFTYMDKMEAQAKKGNEEEEEEEEAVPVTVRFEGPNAERDRQIQQKSYKYLQQKSATEPWIDVAYHPLGSTLSKSEFELLSCSEMSKKVTVNCVSPEDYLKDLVPECLRLSGYHSLRDEESAILLDKPLSDQIKHLMINAHVLRFSTLLEKLSPDVDPVSVERLIQQIAVLVQGCWVVKSELLYDENSVSPLTGLSSKLLISARDYVVWMFTKSRCITRSEVLSAIYVPNEDLTCMISQIAVKSNKVWEFKFPFDAEFVESHRGTEQSQEIKWNLRYKKLVKELSLGLSDPEAAPQKSISPSTSRPRQKRHSRSSMSEEGEESGTDSMSGSKDTKSKRAYSPKKRSGQSPTKAGKAKQFQIATLDVSPTFLETSLPEDVKTDLRDLVGEAIRAQFCMTYSELKELIAESHLSVLVNRSDFEKLLDEILMNLGAQKLKNKWPQNTIPESLYAITRLGNKLDRYRNTLLDLFSTTARTRMNLFVKKVEDELREIISESDCRQIFERFFT
ncbi:DNA-directed RNA polymerase III subunit RPC5-like isoform X2 [Stegodyphus dumicola]|uniref:DNA-directed RNA polymerase III subunit RPC5-like isoform X2 n=1 Tax=Stegodyphus dumicola TaxID=202533 RepID=UPI0015B0BC45|nr:DNA-directed RNA polymerase III subunit RPC5-like isoform X2 [Stegodyphus dumicola]